MSNTRKKKIFREERTTTVDHQTGEISKEVQILSSKVEQEPRFVKMYIDDVLKLKDVPKASSDVLSVLLANMSYGNVVIMIKEIKEIIAQKTGLKPNTVNKSIQNLHKAGILIRKGRSIYVVDPTLFAKGSWEDISKLRLVIDYKPDGTKTINSDMAKQLQLKL